MAFPGTALPCVRICSAALQSFAFPRRSFAKRFLSAAARCSAGACKQTWGPRPGAGAARFAGVQEGTPAMGYLQAPTFPRWISAPEHSPESGLCAARRRSRGMRRGGFRGLFRDCILKIREAPLWGQGREGESFALMPQGPGGGAGMCVLQPASPAAPYSEPSFPSRVLRIQTPNRLKRLQWFFSEGFRDVFGEQMCKRRRAEAGRYAFACP